MAARGAGGPVSDGHAGTTTWAAPAKLTVSLRVTGTRADGYHLLDAEMVTLDLADTLEITGAPDGGGALEVVADWPGGAGDRWDLSVGPVGDNLVTRALAATGRSARVRLVKRIPPGAGLGGGSADAAAVLRWAGCADPAVAAGLGSDVPFCVSGGRARVTGVGEILEPLPFEARSYVLLLPPFGVDTASVYRAWDAARASGPADGSGGNDLEDAALDVEPRLAVWRDALAEASGRRPRLAGSGSTWFVEDDGSGLGRDRTPWLEVGGRRSPLVATRTTPAVGGVVP